MPRSDLGDIPELLNRGGDNKQSIRQETGFVLDSSPLSQRQIEFTALDSPQELSGIHTPE